MSALWFFIMMGLAGLVGLSILAAPLAGFPEVDRRSTSDEVHVEYREGDLLDCYIVSGMGFRTYVYPWPKKSLNRRIEKASCRVKKAGMANLAKNARKVDKEALATEAAQRGWNC